MSQHHRVPDLHLDVSLSAVPSPQNSPTPKYFRERTFEEIIKKTEHQLDPRREAELVCSYVPTCVLQKLLDRGDHAAEVYAHSGQSVFLLVDVTGFTALADSIATQSELIRSADTNLDTVGEFLSSTAGKSLMKFDAFKRSSLSRSLSVTTAQILRKASADVNAMRSAQQLRDTLNGYFEALVSAIMDSGADIVRIAGDCILCTFEVVDEEYEEHAAVKALHAASMWIKDLKDQTLQGYKLSLHIGATIGSLTGFHVGGKLGRWEYVLAGSCIADAGAALEQAHNGSLVVSRDLWTAYNTYYQGPVVLVPQALESGHVKVDLTDAFNTLVVDRSIYRQQTLQRCYENWSWIGSRIAGHVPSLVMSQLFLENVNSLCLVLRLSVIFFRFTNLMEHATLSSLATIQSVFYCAQQHIYSHEGTIKEFTVDDKGCVLVASFGTPPLLHVDDPARACKAALAISDLIAKQHPSVRCSIGITTGYVFCASIGNDLRREFGLLGDSVNLAARFMMAANNEILVDSETKDMACDRIAFESLPPVRVKGKAVAQHVFRAMRRRAVDRDDKPMEQRFPELIGRDENVSQVIQALRNANRGTSIFIQGEVGVGKSRFLKHISTQEKQNFEIVHLAAEGQNKSIEYHGVRTLLNTLFELSANTATALPSGESFRQFTQLVREYAAAGGVTQHLHSFNAIMNCHFENDTFLTTSSSETHFIRVALLAMAIACRLKASRILISIDDAHSLDRDSWELLAGLTDLQHNPIAASLPCLEHVSFALCAVLCSSVHRSSVLLKTQRQLKTSVVVVELKLFSYAEAQLMVSNSHCELSPSPSPSPSPSISPTPSPPPSQNPSRASSPSIHPKTRARSDSDVPRRNSLSIPPRRINGSHPPKTVDDSAETVETFRELSALVFLRSQGICSFIEDIVVNLSKAGLLQNLNGVLQLRKDDVENFNQRLSVPLPFSISCAISTELAQQPASLQMTLKVAAVFGRVFSLDMMNKVHPLAIGNPSLVADDLAACERLGLIQWNRAITGYSDTDKVYEFIQLHSLEVIDRFTPPALANSLHCRIAIELEEVLQNHQSPALSRRTINSMSNLESMISSSSASGHQLAHEQNLVVKLVNHWLLADNESRAIELIAQYSEDTFIEAIEAEFVDVCKCICRRVNGTLGDDIRLTSSLINDLAIGNYERTTRHPRFVTLMFAVMPWCRGLQMARSSFKGSSLTFSAAYKFKRQLTDMSFDTTEHSNAGFSTTR